MSSTAVTSADALLRAGERPTTERIRAQLGRGSPNNVGRLLDAWWAQVGARLTAQQARLDLPQAPPAVAGLASQLWELALTHARDAAVADLESARLALVAERNELTDARQAIEATRDEALARAASADQARALAEARLHELQRLTQDQAAQLQELRQQREQALVAQGDLQAQLLAVQGAHAQAMADATVDRQQRDSAHRASEDRWLQEVDRARQELAKLAGAAQQHERAAEQAAAAQSERLRLAEREAAGHAARATALEKQLERLQDRLHKALAKPTAVAKTRARKTKP